MVTKRCFKCEAVKPGSEFYVKNKRTGLLSHMCKRCCIDRETDRIKSGVAWQCKPENKEKSKARWREEYWKNPDKFRAIGREAYARRRVAARARAKQRYYENQEAEIARSLKWNRDNPDKVKAWVEANRPRVRAATKRYNERNPEAHTISRGARRARMFGAKCERIKPGIDRRLMKQQNGLCPYCRVDLNTVVKHRDHVIPVARGGTHTESNLQLTCKPCNLRKHAKHPLDFAAEMGIVKDPLLIAI